jgi:sugar lactone lactonase YvrE
MAVTKLAGYIGSQGSGDGDLEQATFACPFGIALDDATNLYVTDAQGQSVRKITPTGIVSTLAGQFRAPGGIARDSVGNLYFADTLADTIYRIASFGAVSKIAVFGLGGASVLPVGVAVDASGNIYVVGRGSNVVYKVSPAGVVATFAGKENTEGAADGASSDARFKSPFGVAIDVSGNIFVSDGGNHTIRKITPEGAVTTVAGAPGLTGSSDGIGAASRFRNPSGVTIDAMGNLYIVDNGNRTIRMMTPAGVVSTVAGTALAAGATDGYGALASFKDPYGIVVDGAGNLYVSDCGSNTIRKLTPNGDTRTVTITPPASVFPENGTVTTLAGKPGETGSADGEGSNARFSNIGPLAVDQAGSIIVGDGFPNNLLRKVSPSGSVTTLAGTKGSLNTSRDGTGSQASFSEFPGITVDTAGNIYIPGPGSGGGISAGLRKVTPTGSVSTIDVPIYGGVRLGAITADPIGNIYAIDRDRIDKITLSPISADIFAGQLDSFAPRYHFDGLGSAARFNSPGSIVVDTAGNVFVTDSANLVIRKISPDGVVSTFAGKVGRPGMGPDYDSATVDGIGEAARFDYPVGLAIDGANNLYVNDNHTIRKITPGRMVTTVAGLAGVRGFVDGVGAAARFGELSAIAVDKAGTIYVTDNWTIRKIVQK